MKTLVMIVLMAALGTAFAGTLPIKSGTLKALSDGNNVTIYWGTTDESSVKEFGIERCPATGTDFVLITTLSPKGSNSSYEFVDQSAFKTAGTVFQYRIKIVYVNRSPEYSDAIRVLHSVSGVKRTWGSLKAMFR
jgi:hypothetical protein